MGGYDEMYFRNIVDGGEKLFSVVALESGFSSRQSYYNARKRL